MKSQYRQMEIRLESLERTQAEMDNNARSVGPLTFRHLFLNQPLFQRVSSKNEDTRSSIG